MLWTKAQMDEWRDRGFHSTSRDEEVLEIANWIWHLEGQRVANELPPVTYLECGVWKGFTALAMALAIQEKGTDSKVIGVDIFEKFSKDEVEELLERSGVGNIITLVESDDIEFVGTLPNNSLAGAFVDSNHRYKHVKPLLTAIFPKLSPDALLFGHDYCPRESSLTRAVDEFRKTYGDQLYGWGVFYSLWWTFKAIPKP